MSDRARIPRLHRCARNDVFCDLCLALRLHRCARIDVVYVIASAATQSRESWFAPSDSSIAAIQAAC